LTLVAALPKYTNYIGLRTQPDRGFETEMWLATS